MKIKLKTITPLHIGSGKELTPTEYLIENNYFHRINMNSLFSDPEFQPLMENFITLAENQRYIGELVPADLLKKHILYSLPITGEAQTYLKDNKTIVKEFIKSAGKVFIPGSSLKGSILSAIFWDSLKKAYNSNIFWRVKRGREEIGVKEFITECLRGRFSYDELLNFVFFQFAEGEIKNRFAHWLDVVDSETKNPSDVLQISLAKVRGAKSGKELPILYETIKPGIEFSTEIKAKNTILKEKEILEIVDKFYRKVLGKDKNAISTDRKLLRLGQGSTAYATSCLILVEELGIKNYKVKPPLTRKRIDGVSPLGWLEIIFVE
ncbi:MAG: type III-A CRISPR-associated RAMP protein Csm5 [candidate division WOR-3 bacterium]|uniref:CRISPR system Cms protein Csm5 n=1 Tax=candidate division WOR-3 bacterium TaxID=2052148 RepID=A0A7C4WAE8_UNCW3